MTVVAAAPNAGYLELVETLSVTRPRGAWLCVAACWEAGSGLLRVFGAAGMI